MALVIDSSPLSPTCNSYVSEAEVTAYVTDRIVDSAVKTAWAALPADLRATYIVNATRQLDSGAVWEGFKYSSEQRLAWPRGDVYIDGYIIDSTIVPDAIKDATCELVVWLIGNSGAISQTQDASYDSIKVGPLVIDFNEQVAGSKYKYFPDIIGYIISGYGTLKEPELPSSRSVKVARLIRA